MSANNQSRGRVSGCLRNVFSRAVCWNHDPEGGRHRARRSPARLRPAVGVRDCRWGPERVRPPARAGSLLGCLVRLLSLLGSTSHGLWGSRRILV